MIKDAVRDGLRAVKNAIEDGKYHLKLVSAIFYQFFFHQMIALQKL